MKRCGREDEPNRKNKKSSKKYFQSCRAALNRHTKPHILTRIPMKPNGNFILRRNWVCEHDSIEYEPVWHIVECKRSAVELICFNFECIEWEWVVVLYCVTSTQSNVMCPLLWIDSSIIDFSLSIFMCSLLMFIYFDLFVIWEAVEMETMAISSGDSCRLCRSRYQFIFPTRWHWLMCVVHS